MLLKQQKRQELKELANYNLSLLAERQKLMSQELQQDRIWLQQQQVINEEEKLLKKKKIIKNNKN